MFSIYAFRNDVRTHHDFAPAWLNAVVAGDSRFAHFAAGA